MNIQVYLPRSNSMLKKQKRGILVTDAGSTVTGTQASELTVSKQVGWIQPLPYLTHLSQKWFQQNRSSHVYNIRTMESSSERLFQKKQTFDAETQSKITFKEPQNDSVPFFLNNSVLDYKDIFQNTLVITSAFSLGFRKREKKSSIY